MARLRSIMRPSVWKCKISSKDLYRRVGIVRPKRFGGTDSGRSAPDDDQSGFCHHCGIPSKPAAVTRQSSDTRYASAPTVTTSSTSQSVCRSAAEPPR